MDGERLVLGLGEGVKVLAVAKPFGGLRSGTERGADQQEDPSPVRHNPGGLW